MTLRPLAIFLTGILFALGLGISQMSRPEKVLAFLDLLGNWDPSLLLVMVGAIGVYYPLHSLIRRYYSCPLFTVEYRLPTTEAIKGKSLLGAALFGVGWGMVGLCPGPSIVAMGAFELKLITFFIGLLLGIRSYSIVG